jgi:predicted RecA/RadA family phage recombinase
MAYEIPGFKLGTLVAHADLTSAQYCFVAVNSDGEAILPAGSGGVVIGVLQNKPNVGEPCEIMVNGVSMVKASGAGVTAGDLIMATATTGVATTETGAVISVGVALETAASGVLFACLINCGAGFAAS